jgi:RNA polymerase sigma factor (TIGR02999 family)
MNNDGSVQITAVLIDWGNGDQVALEILMPLVYEELRKMARRYMRQQPSGHTFQTTELIHEAYLKLAKQEGQDWQNRAHFFGVAATAMRHILVDYAAQNTAKNAVDGRKELHCLTSLLRRTPTPMRSLRSTTP